MLPAIAIGVAALGSYLSYESQRAEASRQARVIGAAREERRRQINDLLLAEARAGAVQQGGLRRILDARLGENAAAGADAQARASRIAQRAGPGQSLSVDAAVGQRIALRGTAESDALAQQAAIGRALQLARGREASGAQTMSRAAQVPLGDARLKARLDEIETNANLQRDLADKPNSFYNAQLLSGIANAGANAGWQWYARG